MRRKAPSIKTPGDVYDEEQTSASKTAAMTALDDMAEQANARLNATDEGKFRIKISIERKG